MDTWQRHQHIYHLFQMTMAQPICQKFNMTHEDIHVDGPILLVPNHVCAWDPLLVSISLRDKQIYFVASEHLFRLGFVSNVIDYLVAPIPRRKASTGMDAVKACLRHLKAGHSVCVFAEGEQCWAGQNNPIFPATGKLAKSSGVTLVTYRLEGGYLSLPRWGKGIRRGRVHGHPVGIYPPEVLQTMTAQEVNDLINRDIYEDAWERQRQEPIPYRGKNRAEGMERAVFLCPRCRRIGTLRTKGNRIFCSCGLDLEYLETGFYRPDQPFSEIAEWDAWQKEALRSRDFTREGPDGLLFSDGGVSLYRVGAGHQEELLGSGVLQQYEDRLECAGFRFPLKDISNMAEVLAARLLLSARGEYYEIRSKTDLCFRKYLEVWREK